MADDRRDAAAPAQVDDRPERPEGPGRNRRVPSLQRVAQTKSDAEYHEPTVAPPSWRSNR